MSSSKNEIEHIHRRSWIEPCSQEVYVKVEQRVLGQLIEAVLYEGIVTPNHSGEEPISPGFNGIVTLTGKSRTGTAVEYVMNCRMMQSFNRFRVDRSSIKRRAEDGSIERAALTEFVEEVLGQVQQSEPLNRMLEELEQTLVKDCQAYKFLANTLSGGLELTYDVLESQVIGGHPYHPCYKSRIGFSLQDNAQYGPEFQADLQPVWIALAKSDSSAATMDHIDYEALLKEELGETCFASFKSTLVNQGLDADAYWFMPVHPWQWEHLILPSYHRQFAEQKLVYLGQGPDNYRAQQSIRSWANHSNQQKASIKLSLNITNTSTRRMLARHTVMNAPLVSQWLKSLVKQDETAQQLDYVLLAEFAGITHQYDTLPAAMQSKVYGSLGAIWRESLHRYLKEGEEAIPLHAVTQLTGSLPIIDSWIKDFGLKAWTRKLLEVIITPIIHMLYAFGLALESHAQNIIVIHQQGLPSRIALKDFHDGVRFSRKHVSKPELCPNLHLEPAEHRAMNRHSYMQTDDLSAVTDFVHSAFFFVCISEVSMFLNEQYDLDEAYVWETAAAIIYDYQNQHPEHQANFERYDLFASHIRIEQQARRRLWKDAEVEPAQVPNPLHVYKQDQRNKEDDYVATIF